jgi:serine/threonine protein kinase
MATKPPSKPPTRPALKTEPMLPAFLPSGSSLAQPEAHEVPTTKTAPPPPPQAPVVPPKPDYLPPGFVVNGYTIQDKLGKGAFGAVYLAKREDDFYALKFPLVSVEDLTTAERDETMGRLQREIGTLLQLSHPVVVSVIESWRWPSLKSGFPVMVMPYIAGLPFRRFCREQTPSLSDILSKLLRPLADGLGYLHAKGIVHRDIKSGNILVTGNWEVKLLDFGIARSRAAATMTRQAVLMGTYTHMPPEVFRHFKSGAAQRGEPMPYTPKADLYALGVVIYEAITGAIPRWYLDSKLSNSEQEGIPGEWIDGLLKTPLDKPSVINPALPPEVDELLGRMLATNPSERYDSGAEVVQDLDALLEKYGNEPAWKNPLSVPLTPPEPPPSQDEGRETKDVRSPKHASHNSVRNSLRAGSPPPPPPDSNSRLPSLKFTAPAEGPASFVAPLADAPSARVAATEPDQLPSAIRNAAGRLAATETPSSNRRLLVGGGVLIALLVVATLALKAAGPAPAKPRSLLAESETAPSAAPATPTPSNPAPAPAVLPPAAPQPAPATGAAGAHLVVDQEPAEPLAPGPPPPASVRHEQPAPASRRVAAPAPANPDAKAVDDLLAREYGGKRPVVAPEAAEPAAPAKSNTPSWLKTAHAVGAEAQTRRGALGIAMGTEIPLRLAKPLDSRTVGAGPVVAKLARPFAPRGDVLLPTGTMVYGTAQASGDRFQVRFASIKLTDGTELAVEGLAYDLQDHKPGLKASGRVSSTGSGAPSLAAKVATGTAGAVLSRVGGQDDATAVAKQAGQTILNGAGDQGAGGGASEALLLDAPCDFTFFVSKAF